MQYINHIEALQEPHYRVALIVGHSETSQGAEGNETTEYLEALNLCFRLEENIRAYHLANLDLKIFYREKYKEYSEQMQLVNEYNPHIAIHIHFNSYNGKAHGTEVLYFSENNRIIAKILSEDVRKALGTTPHRGGIVKLNVGDRAYKLLTMLHAPAFILETCYIDSEKDMNKYFKHSNKLVKRLSDFLNRRAVLFKNNNNLPSQG